MRHIASADALVLASTHEGLPHVVIEALVSGTPVVTMAVGGIPELVDDGRNGLIVDVSVTAFAGAFERMANDSELAASLRRGALESGEVWRFDRCVDRLESLMRQMVVERPLAVYVGKSRAAIPPRPDDVRKYEINERYVHTYVLCTAERFVRQRPGGATVVGLPFGNVPAVGSVLFYALAPALAVAVAVGRKRDTAIVARARTRASASSCCAASSRSGCAPRCRSNCTVIGRRRPGCMAAIHAPARWRGRPRRRMVAPAGRPRSPRQ